MAQLSCVVWFDNWHLKRYHSDSVVSRTSIDVAALTVFYLEERSGKHTLPFWHGQMHRGLPCSHVRLAAVTMELCRSFSSLREGVKTFLDMEVGVKDIRVPLDVQRESQLALRWQPFWLTDTEVKSNQNLLNLLGDDHGDRGEDEGQAAACLGGREFALPHGPVHVQCELGQVERAAVARQGAPPVRGVAPLQAACPHGLQGVFPHLRQRGIDQRAAGGQSCQLLTQAAVPPEGCLPPICIPSC